MKYFVIMIDLKNSKKMNSETRLIVQDKFIDIVEGTANKLFSTELVTNLCFSAGDSIQGVFHDFTEAVKCYRVIKALMYPYEIRCGIGFGKIIGVDRYYDTNKLDGEAFHNASKAIKYCKENNLDICFVSNNDENEDALITNALNMASNDDKYSLADVYINKLMKREE